MMLQMSSIMRDTGVGPNGGGGFPMPGLPSTARQNPDQTQQQQQGAGAGTGAAAGGPLPFFNPFFPPPPSTGGTGSPGTGAGTGAGAGAGAGAGGAGAGLWDPAMMQQMMNILGGAGGDPFGFGALGGLGGAAGAAGSTPADTRPPEERFQVQLQV